MRVLIVEEQSPDSVSLAERLRRCGEAGDVFQNCGEGEVAVSSVNYDLVVLDLSALNHGGASVLRRLRSGGNDIPVVVLTASDRLAVRIRLLNLGADCCLVKPFEIRELQARMRAIMRRALIKAGSNVIDIGGLSYDLRRRSVSHEGRKLALSPRESAVLESLVLRPGRVISKAQIRGRLSDWAGQPKGDAIEVYVHRLRRRLAGTGVQVRTVRGYGYMLERAEAASRVA
jgi:DNA-binding response OmpR family regulator